MAERPLPDRFADELTGSPYAHVRSLAQGGMGEVHVVVHRMLGTEAVMKVIRARLLDDEERLTKRLIVEARSLRSMRHPNLVEVLDFGFTNAGRAYLVTELLHGRTLKQELKERGRLPLAEALDVVAQALAGLTVVHQAGVVHRDLKPDNLFYGIAGGDGARTLKVLDFGVAKILTAEAKLRAGPVVPTQDGFTVGTPLYMSPEQVLARPVDARADLYGLGAVLYHLLAGQPPYVRENAALVMEAHVMAPVPGLRALVSDLPPAVEAFVAKAMAKAAADRFASANDMLTALAALPRTSVLSKRTVPMTASGDARPRGRAVPPPAVPRSAADAETKFESSLVTETPAVSASPPRPERAAQMAPRDAPKTRPAALAVGPAWEPGAAERFRSLPPAPAPAPASPRWLFILLWIASVLVVAFGLVMAERLVAGW